MPTYGYQCTQCDNAFETVQKITDDPLTTCDNCGGQLRKKIFPVGISFKGSGFYVNDYAKSTGNASTAAAAPAPESKPDASAATPSAASQDSSASTSPASTPASAPAPATAASTPAAGSSTAN